MVKNVRNAAPNRLATTRHPVAEETRSLDDPPTDLRAFELRCCLSLYTYAGDLSSGTYPCGPKTARNADVSP